MGSDKELEEYERDYLKRLEEKKNTDEIQNIHNPTPDYYEEKVESVDYVIMALMRNGLSKYQNILQRINKIGVMEYHRRLEKLERMGYIKTEKEGGWIERNTNPSLYLEKKGEDLIEEKIIEMEDNWALLVKHFEAKEKQPLKEDMFNMKSMLPLMLIMGIANGAMMSQMLQMNHMNMHDYFIEQPIQIDYLTDPSGEPYTNESGGDFEGGGFEAGF